MDPIQAQFMPQMEQPMMAPPPEMAMPPAFEQAQAPVSPSDISDRNIIALRDEKGFVAERVKEILESEETLNPWKTRLIKYYELYQMVQNTKNYDGLAKIFVPEILRAVETVVAKMLQMLVNNENWFEFKGREAEDDLSSKAMTQLVRYQMGENNFRTGLVDSLRQLCIAGFTVRKIGWDFRQVRQTTIGPDGQPKKGITVVNDFWTFEPVDLISFHISDINTHYTDIGKARWLAEQTLVDNEWVMERMRRGWFSSLKKEDIKKIINGKESQAKTFLDRRNKASGFNAKTPKGKHEVIERWGLLAAELVYTPEEMAQQGLQPDEMVETVCVIVDREFVVKLEANPFWHGLKPYVGSPYVAKEGEFAGMGVAQIGEKLQEELNDTRNQTMDNKTLNLSGMWLKSRTSGIKNADLKIRANGVIQTNDMMGLQPLRPPVLAGVGVNIENVVKSDLRESVGAASNLQGIAQSGVDTATESSIINRESLGRLLLTTEMYSELILKPMLIRAEFMNYQFYDHVKVIKVVGETGAQFKSLTPEEIRSSGQKDIIITLAVDASESPAVRRQQMMNFLTIVQGLPPELLAYHWKLLDKIYGMFFHGRSLSELYEAPPMPELLLTPDQEIDMVIAEQPVYAKKGQDHKQHIVVLEEFLKNTDMALSQMSFDILKSLLVSHYQLLQQEVLEQQQALQEQLAAQNEKESEREGKVDGRTPNATPFTQTKTPSQAGLQKQVSGVA